MEFAEVVKNRYSCKKYDEKQISGRTARRCSAGGRLAPTAKNLQASVFTLCSPRKGWLRLTS